MRLPNLPAAVVVAGGLAVGLAWGVNARLWMRFISDDPEFSWSGTLFIVIGFGVVGLSQGAALFARRATWPRVADTAARVLGFVGLLPLFVAAGALLMPTVVGGGVAVARRNWPRSVRGSITLIALLPVGVVAGQLVDDFGWGPRTLAGLVWLVVIYGGIVIVVAAATFAPRPRLWRVPKPVKITAGLGVLLLVAYALREGGIQ